MSVYVNDPDFTLHLGDVLDVLRELPDESVHCCVTSPPYWGLRDYGTGTWEGGTPDCDHKAPPTRYSPTSTLKNDGRKNPGAKNYELQTPTPFRDVCGKCGATRVDRQLGLEPTPEEFVARMVGVFAEVRRVLRSDGTCWLNIGDSYARVGGEGGHGPNAQVGNTQSLKQRRMMKLPEATRGGQGLATNEPAPAESWRVASGVIKEKDLVGIPWRLAFALQADGWYLRSDIIWSKPNPMPESVTDRPTKAHEYLFLLTKSARYFYDADAIREPAEWARWGDQTVGPGSMGWMKPRPKDHFRNSAKYVEQGAAPSNSDHAGDRGEARGFDPGRGRNKRSVWEIATESYPEAHFATFPQALVEPCVKAGCPEGGTVLDPFSGSGTTALVARRLGRKSVGIELNPEYAELAARRLSQLSLLAVGAA